jgi:L-erythro-3,5-diaminohexanoate dehydrogenase
MTGTGKPQIFPGGNPFGTHRVITPNCVLPQPAEKINNDTDIIWDNEILIDVDTLNIDSASFTQIRDESGGDKKKIEASIMSIVSKRGKMQNPVTGSGGMLIGRVLAIGNKLASRSDLDVGDKIASLVSLSLTPLRIEKILDIKTEIEQVKIKGKAVLFESGVWAKLPDDIPETLALAVLDVAGAPAQTERLVKDGNTVVIIGATGKSGILCAHTAKKRAGKTGRVIGIGHSDSKIKSLEALGLCDDILKLNAKNALSCHDAVFQITEGHMADVVINCVNIPDTEMASILCCRNRGIIYFFSMATSFTKAALGAEGVGKDVDMIVGNGYAAGHSDIALNIIRQSKKIYSLYESIYA